jgi:phosphoserine phosphatase SerB
VACGNQIKCQFNKNTELNLSPVLDHICKEYAGITGVTFDSVWAARYNDGIELLLCLCATCPPACLNMSNDSQSPHYPLRVEISASKRFLPTWDNVNFSCLPSHCITLVSSHNIGMLPLLRDITNAIEKQNPHCQLVAIKHLSGDAPPPTPSLAGYTALDFLFRVVDTTTTNDNNIEEKHKHILDNIRAELRRLSQLYRVDLFLQAETESRHYKRLVVFDMDSTLIQQECLDEMAHFIGVVDEVKHITQRAMNGELDFEQSLRTRVRLLKGQGESLFKWMIRRITLTPGAEFLCAVLKRLGVRLAVISGGFRPFVSHIQQKLALDYAFANQFEIVDGALTGEVVGPIVDAQRKADLLESIALEENILLSQVIAVGDGANDVLMLARAGLGIAFNAKPNVQQVVEHRLNQPSLSTILYLMGFTHSQLATLLSNMTPK